MDINKTALREWITEHFSEAEFALMCDDLNETDLHLTFNFKQDIPTHLDFSFKVMETIKYLQRRGMLDKLVAQIEKNRPDLELSYDLFIHRRHIAVFGPFIPPDIEGWEETWIKIRKWLRNPNYYSADTIRNQLIPDLGYSSNRLAGPEASLAYLINSFTDKVQEDGKFKRLISEMKAKIPNIETLLGSPDLFKESMSETHTYRLEDSSLNLAERIQKISQDLTQKASQLPADQLQEAQGYLKDAEEKAQAPAPSSALIKFRLEKTLEIVLVHLNGDPNLVGQLDLAISLSKKI